MSQLWNIPNVISLIRLALIPVFVWLVVAGDYGWAGVLLGVIGSTDWIDGYLARRLGQVTEVGEFLDPLADRIAVVVAVVAGLLTGVLPAWFAFGLLVRELLIAGGALYGWSHGVAKLEVRYLGKLATLLLYVAVTLFYLGAGFAPLAWMVVAGVIVGLPGLVIYYWVAVQYFFDMRKAVAQAR
jgi:cardiolipin synthase